MYRQNSVLVGLLAPVVSALGYEMLGIEQMPGGRDSLLRIYIDSEFGIRLEDCERVSERVAGLLDVHDPIRGSYRLEISSPGFDRPLFTLEHFRRFIGRPARLQLREKTGGRRKITGTIMAVNDGIINMEMDGAVYQVQADNIDRARLVPVE
jgi:ribosome maturation factor RimP